MKKTLLAAALLAGFATAGVAQAETSVTLYGILDASYTYKNVKVNDAAFGNADLNYRYSKSGLGGDNMNGNRWGLRGSEDLGDGLRAIFVLEQGFNIGTGGLNSNRQWHRQGYVGLASDDWGTFTMGRQYGIGANFIYDSFAVGGYGLGDPEVGFGAIGYGNRVDNSFKYVTPSFSGLQFGILYGSTDEEVVRNGIESVKYYDANGEQTYKDEDYSNNRQHRLSTGLKYANGPLTLAATYDRNTTQGNDKDSATSWNLGASYDFEVVKVALMYGQDRHDKMGWIAQTPFKTLSGVDSNGETWNDFRSHNWYLALTAPVGSGTLAASWLHSRSNLDELYNAAGDSFNETKLNVYHLRYSYPLSKRTFLYAYGNYATGVDYIDNAKAKEVGVGLRHAF